ncbi:MAG: hypothetical protein KF894_24345 [Labilithrix sp.]|nr:hypothetical protein [Labilithrix sp.]
MRKAWLVPLVLAMTAALGSACSEETVRPAVLDDGRAQPAPGGGSSPSDGGGEGDLDAGDAGSCTSLENTGLEVEELAVNDDLPPGTGGTVADGVYDISTARVYQGAAGLPGPTGNVYQGSIRVTDQVYERVLTLKSAAGASAETRSAGTFTPAGNNATIAITCPSALQEQVTYTALDNSLVVSNLVTKTSLILTKRP